MDPPLGKLPSRWNFVMNTTMYIHPLKTTIFKQNKQTSKQANKNKQTNKQTKNKQTSKTKIPVIIIIKKSPFQNVGRMTDFQFASFGFGENLKIDTFPKEFFNEMWRIIGDHNYCNNNCNLLHRPLSLRYKTNHEIISPATSTRDSAESFTDPFSLKCTF